MRSEHGAKRNSGTGTTREVVRRAPAVWLAADPGHMFARRSGGSAVADRTTPMPGVDSGEFAPPGILAGRYVIERELGRGATATVYLARDTKYDRLVAAKTLNRELAYALGPSRFLREIEITARLQHPNILSIHDSGEIDGLLYYVTPYLEGDTLRARLTKERQLPVDVAVRITTELADALHYAHERGIVHRDIKPENILFSGGHACLADFGIAHAIQRAGGDRLTTTGLVLGTPAYMSPEQAAGERELDGRSDLYSLACVLYEMLAGMAPFIGPTPESVVAQRFSHMPRAVRAFRAGVPPHVERALGKAFSLAPADRFPDTRAFAEALTNPASTTETATQSVRQPWWRSRWAVPAVVSAIALGIVILAKNQFGIGRPTMSASRVAVLPFSGVGGRQLTTELARRGVYDAFRRWHDLDLVDLGTVGQLLEVPVADRDAASVARRLGAGQLVQGVVTPVGDSVRIDAAVYDLIQRRRTGGLSITVPDARSLAGDGYRAVATSLLREVDPLPGVDMGDEGTNSIVAWRAYQRGIAARQRWDLPVAEREFRSAATSDPSYAQAQLWLAQVIAWSRYEPRDHWAEPATRALGLAARLSERERLLTRGLVALAQQRFAIACDRYAELIAVDSLDAAAWLGRGECQSRDPGIVRDSRSPSGWRFVTSQHSGVRAFRRALELAPDAHSIIGIARRRRLLFAAPNRYRVGYATPIDSFAALPSFDPLGDSVGFVPHPFALFLIGDPRTVPATLDLAVRRQREILLQLARDWVARHPRAADAHESLAYALELRGELGTSRQGVESALSALRNARRLTADSAQATRLMVAEVRVLLKREEFAETRQLIDSIVSRATPAAATQLAGLAALTGRAGETARLLRLMALSGASGPNTVFLNERIPEQVRDPAASLLAHAALGVCDSIRSLTTRVERAIDTHVEPSGRDALWTEVVARAYSLSAPCDRGTGLLRVAKPVDRLMRMQQALARGNTIEVRAHFDTLNRYRRADRPGDVAIDYTFQEAWLLAAIGDTTAAIRRLDKTLGALSTLGDVVAEHVPQAGALGRAMRLRADLARQLGDDRTANQWASALAELWKGADSAVRAPGP